MSGQKVLDSWAVLCYLEHEPGYEEMIRLLETAANSKPLLMCVVNWGEVLYAVSRRYGQAKADEVERIISTFPIQLVDADMDLTREASVYKASKRMSYADCFAAALAKIKKAELVTGDMEFKAVEGEIKVKWLGLA